MSTHHPLTLLIALGFAAPAFVAEAQPAEAAGKALTARYAGSDNTVGLLKEPAVRAQLQKLVGAELRHLERNLDVKSSVDLIGGALAISGNAPHGGTEEEAVVCIAPIGPIVEAAIFSKGQITVFAKDPTYDFLLLCTKDWITQVNSHHADRFKQPRNVRVAAPR